MVDLVDLISQIIMNILDRVIFTTDSNADEQKSKEDNLGRSRENKSKINT